MPQVDKVTFYSIALWFSYIYAIGYVFCTVTIFFTFCNQLKLLAKFKTLVYHRARVRQTMIFTITNFPYVTDCIDAIIDDLNKRTTTL